jgi:enterochelin esterase-like enzyme
VSVRPVRRPVVALLSLALAVAGLWGVYGYWESYYQHRGFTTVAYLPHARRGHVETVEFYSPALHRRADYLASLPPGYDRSRRRYPVYYVLHGSPGRPEVFVGIAGMPVRMDNLLSRHRMRPMILVFPDGRIGGSTYSDSEWATTRAGDFAGYVMNVVADVDQRFRTIADRRDRVIAGFSAGAYGATNIALHNLATFAALESWSGYYLETRSGVFAGADRAQLTANSPRDYVSGLRPQFAADPFRAFLFIGRDDDLSPQTQPMAVALADAGATVSDALYPGGHDWQLWHAHLNQMLILASRDTLVPPGRSSGRARTLTPGVVPIPHGLGRHHHGRRAARARRRHNRHRRGPDPRPRRATVTFVLTRFVTGRRSPPGRLSGATLVGGLVLALVSAALINLGFLLQHRGLARMEGADDGWAATARAALRDRAWLAGQMLGWMGFAAQIAAVALAPLALVQAFAAGGLALSVPLAAGIFGQRIDRRQRRAVLVIAAGLTALPIGFSTAEDRLGASTLVVVSAVLAAVGLACAVRRSAALRAIAAGLFYGVADAAIKAVSLAVHHHGAGALASGWTAVAAAGTFAGFLSFQAALRDGGAVSAISLMNAFAALVALACGLLAFGESLGARAAATVAHVVAIAVVLGAVPVLAAAQAAIVEAGPERDQRPAPPAGARAVGSQPG